MSSHINTPPRVRAGSPPLSLSFPSSVRDSVSSYTSSGSRFKEHLSFDIVPITPGVPERSHFSPSTPSVERGFGRARTEKERPASLRDRVGRALSWTSPEPEPCPCGHRHKPRGPIRWLLLALLVLVLVFLLANVIVLDVHMGAHVQQLSGTTTTPHVAASASVSLTPAPSPTPSAVTAANLASIPQNAQSCVSQVPSSPATTSVYCARCVPALYNIPLDWFVAQARDGQNGQANLQNVADAAQYCSGWVAGTG